MTNNIEEINNEYAKEQRFRERLKKLTKDELIDRMLNMKAFIDDLVSDEE